MRFVDHTHFEKLHFRKLLNWKIASILVVAALLSGVVYVCSGHNEIPAIIHSWGLVGVFAAVLLMALFHLTPIPSDGLLIMYFKVFGVTFGLFYGWLGSLLSALCVYFLARILGQGLLHGQKFRRHFEQVDKWVERKGQGGLLMARLLPIPAFAMNCVAGVMPSIRLSTYFWTAAVAILPYYASMGLVYIGMETSLHVWAYLGAGALIGMWIVSYLLSGQRIRMSSVIGLFRRGIPRAS